MLKAYQTRWNKLRHFTFDDGTATDSFAPKTTSLQNWTTAFTARAISEYKKFLLLCSVSPTGAAPPQIVDKAWPPTDIWPPPGKKIPPIKAPPFTWSTKIPIAFTAYLLLTFALCIFVFRQPTSYFINGPEFIIFFAVYTACILPALSRYLQHKLKQTELNAIFWFPEDALPFNQHNAAPVNTAHPTTVKMDTAGRTVPLAAVVKAAVAEEKDAVMEKLMNMKKIINYITLTT